MTITFRTNIAALRAQRMLSLSEARLAQTFERLSSGSRINRPSDDAAGLAVASQLQASARVYSQGIRNINDGISALNIAEGTTTQLTDVLHRLRELGTQAANGILGLTQRTSLDNEAYELTNEYNRLIGSTRFNGLSLLTGSVSQLNIQAGIGTDETLGFGLGQGLQRNKGIGSFNVSSSFLGSGGVAGTGNIQTGDLDGDGDLDMVSADGFGNILDWINDGSGNFTPGAGFPTGYATEVRLADWNNDGRLDVIANSSVFASQVVIFNAAAGGGYTAVRTITLTGFSDNQVTRLDVGDVNGDGFTDLIVGAPTDDLYKVILNGGRRNFGTANFVQQSNVTQNITTGGFRELNLYDLNDDGKLDLIDSMGADLEVHYGNGDGTFQSSRVISVTGNAQSVSFGDINHDGRTDMLIGTSLGSFYSRQNQNGNFISSLVGNAFSTTTTVRILDLNTDGNLDLYFNRSGANEIWYGNGAGSFTQGANLSGTGSDDLDVGDFNNDGVIDIVNRYSGGVVVNLQNTEKTVNIQRLNFTTKQAALDSLAIIDAALARVSTEKGSIGSVQSRLGIALNNLLSRKDEYLGAAARITDIDVAKESAESVRLSILQQTAVAVAGQANVSSQIGLDLLTSAARSNRLI